MGEVVGFVHHKVYRKIQLQEEFNQALSAICEQGEEIISAADKEVGLAPVGELENIIEADNVHGWLQGNMTIVEQRMIYILKTLLLQGVTKETMMEVAYQFGSKHQVIASSCQEAWNMINDLLINGMPCDRVIQTQLGEQQIQVDFVENIHLHNLEQYQVSVELFEEVRYAFVRGLLDQAQFESERVDSSYIIRKI